MVVVIIKTMALEEIRSFLPHGDPGRIVNAFIFHSHPDTLDACRAYRKSIGMNITSRHRLFIKTCAIFGKIRSFYRKHQVESCYDFLFELPELLEEFEDDELSFLLDGDLDHMVDAY